VRGAREFFAYPLSHARVAHPDAVDERLRVPALNEELGLLALLDRKSVAATDVQSTSGTSLKLLRNSV
jgi:hypothetical protein